MITLKEPTETFWHPKGDKDGNPLKITVDKAVISSWKNDLYSRRIEVTVMYGYINAEGVFEFHKKMSGAMDVSSFILVTDRDSKKPEEKGYTEFLSSVSAKGAPHGNFRERDLEDILIAKSIIDGTIDK
jgi:hypothetical protein